MTAFASLIGELCRLCFLMTIPLPTGPGLPWAEPSVYKYYHSMVSYWVKNILNICFFCFFRYKFVWQCEFYVRNTEYFKRGRCFCWGILMRWESILRFFEIVIQSCLTWSDDLMRQRGRFITNYSFLYIVRNVFIIFLKLLIASVLCSSFSLRSIGAMQSSVSITSIGVNLIALSISISAPFWAASRRGVYGVSPNNASIL